MNPIEVMKAAKKKKRLTIRDFRYWDLEHLVHEGLLDKVYSKLRTGRNDGWPSYKLSVRGNRSLEKTLKALAQ